MDDKKLWERYDKDTNQIIEDRVGCIYNREKGCHFLQIDDEKCHQHWTYHLQLMVLEKEPLKYLEKFL